MCLVWLPYDLICTIFDGHLCREGVNFSCGEGGGGAGGVMYYGSIVIHLNLVVKLH